MKDQKIYVLLFSLLFAPLVWGAGSNASHWTFDPAEYAYDMNVHAALMFNGMDVEDYAAFEVAAFCGNECRGIAKATVSQGKKYYELRVYSKKSQGDNITFKCYNQATGRELMVAESLLFDGEQHGTLSRLFQLTATQPVTGISLDKTSVTLNTTETYTLIANVDPTDASNKSVTWSSSDAAIATVDDKGIVTGIKAGTATITVTTVDGNFTAACAVTVFQPVTGVRLDKTEVTLNVAESTVLQATVLPADASNQTVEWSSSNDDIAIIDNGGKITAVAIGNAIITVTTTDGSHTATCQIIVKPILVASVKITCEEEQLLLTPNQQTLHLSASVLPENATDKDLVWSIESGDDLATITQNGVLQAIDGVKKDGEVVVRATAVDQSNAYDEVTVSLQGFATGIQSFDQQAIFISSPVTDRLYIRGDFDRLKHISIIDSSGRICIQVEQLLSGESIDVSPLSRGVYYVMMEKKRNRILQKFIKMK